MLVCAILSLLVVGGTAHADTIVLTPHVPDRTVGDGKQIARRIGDALRSRFGNTVRRSETRTLRTIGEALQCDALTVRCLGLIASALRVDVIVSGELRWQSRMLVLQLFRSARSAGISVIEEPVTGDLLGAHFDAWIAHLIRRIQGQREGSVVFWDLDPDLKRARIKLGGRDIELGEPMFVPEGAHLLTIERNGEVLSLGSVMVTDGRHVTRGIYPESGTKRPPPDPGPGPADTAFVACWQARPSGGLDLERSFGPAGSIGSTDRRLAYFGGMFETRARIEPLIVGIQSFLGTVYESDRSSRQTTQGFGWSVLLHAGVGTSLAPPIAASITLGIGGSGATGIIRQALELPIEARVELPGQTWAMGYARTTLVFSDQRAHGSGIPLFDELEAGVELKRLDISPLNVGLRLQYREALGQRFIGAWLLFGVRQCRRPARNNPDGCNPREEVVAP